MRGSRECSRQLLTLGDLDDEELQREVANRLLRHRGFSFRIEEHHVTLDAPSNS